MITKVTIEVEPQHEAFVRQAAAMAEEMEQLALTADDGKVFDACEEAVIEKGRRLQRHALGDAVTRRIESAESAEKKRVAPALRMRSPKGKQRAEGTASDDRRR